MPREHRLTDFIIANQAISLANSPCRFLPHPKGQLQPFLFVLIVNNERRLQAPTWNPISHSSFAVLFVSIPCQLLWEDLTYMLRWPHLSRSVKTIYVGPLYSSFSLSRFLPFLISLVFFSPFHFFFQFFSFRFHKFFSLPPVPLPSLPTSLLYFLPRSRSELRHFEVTHTPAPNDILAAH